MKYVKNLKSVPITVQSNALLMEYFLFAGDWIIFRSDDIKVIMHSKVPEVAVKIQ